MSMRHTLSTLVIMLAAALLLDQAGFDVDLYEKRDTLGGNLIASATPPGKEKLFWYLDFLKRRLATSGVRIHLRREINASEPLAGTPKVVIMAVGSELAPLELDDKGKLPIAPAYKVLLGDLLPPFGTSISPVVIFGGGETGAETAEFLASLGHDVLLVTRSGADKIARNAEPLYRRQMLERLHANSRIRILDQTRVIATDEGCVTLSGKDGTRQIQPACYLLLAHGLVPARLPEERAVHDASITICIGDANRIARIGEAVNDAYRAVQNLRRSLAREDMIAC